MKSISLYVDRDSILHRIDPVNKMIYILAAIALPILVPTLYTALICMLLSLLLLRIGKVFQKSLPVYGFVFLILITVILIQGLFHPSNETPLFSLGLVTYYREGFLFALLITFRVINIVGSFLILVLTTKPSDLVESLVRRGLSPRFGYVLGSVFQIVPQMMSTMKTITDAQRSRGMETEGSLFVRIKAFLPLIGPVVLSSLIHVKERAMALEVRGFNAKGEKTFLHEEKAYVATRPIQWGLWIVMVTAAVWRIFL
ncbi:energy-coupling factor transporter transmembrane component T family protein [Kroppenstedtia eburnea]|uniref:energy-coupling factor transporter transmembrane component T family protein n=1 Tax=Kroppenstedtia eburnea TaxID=714067 RepID=UPI00363D1BBB